MKALWFGTDKNSLLQGLILLCGTIIVVIIYQVRYRVVFSHTNQNNTKNESQEIF